MEGEMAATRKVALNFDPRYLTFLLHAWNQHQFQPMPLDELKGLALQEAEEHFTRLNAMGLLEEEVSADKVGKAMNVLKGLKLTTEKKVGPKANPMTRIAPTKDGKSVLEGEHMIYSVPTHLVQELVASSPDLLKLLSSLETDGPLCLPAYVPDIDAPKKKALVQRAAQEGITRYLALAGTPALSLDSTGTPAAQIKRLAEQYLAFHPAGQLKGIDKLIALAEQLGLIWTHAQRVSSVVVVRKHGLAAQPGGNKGYAPRIPEWPAYAPTFAKQLIKAHAQVADSSGFAAIEDLRGMLGEDLGLSAPVIDDFIGRLRDAADRREVPIRLHFEEDEEMLYEKGRHPLIWHGRAFDFVEVVALSEEENQRLATGAMFRRGQ
jgi:hypothetical protein